MNICFRRIFKHSYAREFAANTNELFHSSSLLLNKRTIGNLGEEKTSFIHVKNVTQSVQYLMTSQIRNDDYVTTVSTSGTVLPRAMVDSIIKEYCTAYIATLHIVYVKRATRRKRYMPKKNFIDVGDLFYILISPHL